MPRPRRKAPLSPPAQWVCRVCGYVYDPALHNGVPFEDLPADYRCPGCGYPKSVFFRRRPGKIDNSSLEL
jgi:rubredoxin